LGKILVKAELGLAHGPSVEVSTRECEPSFGPLLARLRDEDGAVEFDEALAALPCRFAGARRRFARGLDGPYC
jgi:hypothetical protein